MPQQCSSIGRSPESVCEGRSTYFDAKSCDLEASALNGITFAYDVSSAADGRPQARAALHDHVSAACPFDTRGW